VAAGPRAAFLKARRPELLRERNLATWLVKSDTEFAELIVEVGPRLMGDHDMTGWFR